MPRTLTNSGKISPVNGSTIKGIYAFLQDAETLNYRKTSDGSFENETTATGAWSGVVLTPTVGATVGQQTTASLDFSTLSPVPVAKTYIVTWMYRAGASPDYAADTVAAAGLEIWDGTQFLDNSVDVNSINGNTTAADALRASAVNANNANNTIGVTTLAVSRLWGGSISAVTSTTASLSGIPTGVSFVGGLLLVVSGAGVGQWRKIIAHTVDDPVVTLDRAWDTNPGVNGASRLEIQPDANVIASPGRQLAVASDGTAQTALDLADTDPGAPANWTTLGKTLIAFLRTFKKKTDRNKSTGTMRAYADDGTTVNATLTVTASGSVETKAEAS